MKRRGSFILWFVCAIIFAGFVAENALCEKAKTDEDNIYSHMELFAEAVGFIRTDYVDEVKMKDIIYGALKGMLSSLDAHSQFMGPEEHKEIKIETKGEFGGLGIEIGMKEGLLTVITPIDGSPAYQAGIKAGDIIVKIDGESTKGITLQDAVNKMRGSPGTNVTLTILREKERKVFDVTVTRGIIQLKSIRDSYIIEDGIGYIRLAEFQEKTPKDLEEALLKLQGEGMDSLILDLRNNPGGLMEVSVAVAGLFLPEGKTIVSTKGRKAKNDIVYKSQRKPICPDCPMVVMVNEGSASASEIVSGAIQDNRRGIILGTKTYGKGSVQTVIPLKDGSALRLTTAKYFTPSGRVIRDEKIVPDVMVEYQEPREDVRAKEEAIFEKLEGTQKKIIDNQLLTAIDVLKGIKAYKVINNN